MRHLWIILVLISVCIVFSGCYYAPETGRNVPDEKLVYLRPGFSRRSDVQEIFGTPQRTIHSSVGTIFVYYHAEGGMSFCGLPVEGTECEVLMITLRDDRVSRYSYH